MKTSSKVYSAIAKLTRRDEVTIRTTAELLLGPEANFFSEDPLWRLWNALETIERFGVPATSLFDWSKIVGAGAASEQRFTVARDLKEAIKARFEPEAWQRVARPIFDKLRQRQRDALVSHVMHQCGFTSIEQLYEYFLVDPGMEPVVQTSRIRLAISSVQTFIQRCLLNLEANVPPCAIIHADQWEWMKRYRVWEANRKIFLFPENWLEPELRDDKTYQFDALEGALLQDDVSGDLVEDAFLAYLKNLDELARLDIVAIHLETQAEWSQNRLHVIGRTFSEPYKYFYRHCSHRMWTPWEPIPVEIEGNHLAPVVWRDRLYLFWVTFMEKTAPTDQGADRSFNLPAEYTDPETAPVKIPMSEVETVVEARLHWIEYFQGQWSPQESGGLMVLNGQTLNDSTKAAYIHAETRQASNGRETVSIHLGEPFNQAFYLIGRNSPPTIKESKNVPEQPYNLTAQNATKRYGKDGTFSVNMTGLNDTFVSDEVQDILNPSSPYTILTIDQELLLSDVNNSIPEKPLPLIKNRFNKIASLVKPFFYQDNQNTFFVEPSITEETIEGWQGWVPQEDAAPSDYVTALPTAALPILVDSKLFDVEIRYKEAIKKILDPKVNSGLETDKVKIQKSLDSIKSDFISSESICQNFSMREYNPNEVFSQANLKFDGQLIGASGLIKK